MVRRNDSPPQDSTDGQLVDDGEDVPPYIRAVTRDLKNYIANHSPRLIPVGYSAADVRDVLTDTFAYLSCAIDGEDDPSRSDFFGLNCKPHRLMISKQMQENHWSTSSAFFKGYKLPYIAQDFTISN